MCKFPGNAGRHCPYRPGLISPDLLQLGTKLGVGLGILAERDRQRYALKVCTFTRNWVILANQGLRLSYPRPDALTDKFAGSTAANSPYPVPPAARQAPAPCGRGSACLGAKG
jgi:hypothetical protein